MIIPRFLIFVILAPLALFASCQVKNQPALLTAKPNIIYIIADDMGYGDLSCYEQQKLETPNIDSKATKGMLFTRHC